MTKKWGYLSADHVLKKLFTTVLWVLDVTQVKNNENQRLYSNHVSKNSFDKSVICENGFPLRENIHCTCSGEKQSWENVSVLTGIVQAL